MRYEQKRITNLLFGDGIIDRWRSLRLCLGLSCGKQNSARTLGCYWCGLHPYKAYVSMINKQIKQAHTSLTDASLGGAALTGARRGANDVCACVCVN
jgi:hypothetical protein